MIFTDAQVWQACKAVAPTFTLDPYLVMAVNEQECDHRVIQNGKRVFDLTKYDASVCRPEANFYDRYVRKLDYSTCVEGLLSLSYSTMQMMGESLRECRNLGGQNYFEWRFAQLSPDMQKLLREPMTPFAVINALDYYCESLELSVEWGCRWMSHKRKLAGGDLGVMLDFWNGDRTGAYRKEVTNRIPRLKTLHK